MKRLKSMLAMSLALTMLIACLMGIKFPTTINAEGNTIYVSISGSDETGDGTVSNPYRTLYKSSKKLTEGATLIIGGGAYGPTDSIWLTKSGTAENPITIKPAEGEVVTISGTGMYNRLVYTAGVSNAIIKNIIFDNFLTGRPVQITASNNVIIDGCTFRNGVEGGDVLCYTGSSYCTIRNSIFDTNGGDLLGSGAGDAINAGGSHHMLIENNYFTKNGHYAIFFGSFGAFNSHNNIIRKNYVDEKWGGGVGIAFNTQNTIIEDNLIKNAGEQCLTYPKTAVQIACDTTILRNNLLLSSKHGRVELQSEMAFDGNLTTGWQAPYSLSSPDANEKHWLAVDLGSVQAVDNVVINWGPDYSTRTDGTITNYQYYSNFEIQTSLNGQDWDTVSTIINGTGGVNATESITFALTNARYVRMNGIAMPVIGTKKTTNGCKINEFQVFNTSNGNNNLALNKISSASATFGSYDNGVCLYSYEYTGGYIQNCINNRVYNNVIYGNGGAAVAFSQRGVTIDTKNKVLNNIMYKNRANGFFSDGGIPGYYTITAYVTGSTNKWDPYPNDNSIYNNIILHADNITQYPGYDKLFYFDYGSWSKSLVQVQTDYPGFIFANKEENPLFVDEYAEDFSLKSNSPAIDAGAHLAKTTTAAATPANQVQVDDALFFSDGYGIIPGDQVVIGQNPANRITAIDYITNTLTLETAITFSAGEWVDLPYSGSSPDMGAIEYGTPGNLPTAISSMPPLQTLAPSATPAKSPAPTPVPTSDPADGPMKTCFFATPSQGDGIFKYTFSDGSYTTYNGIATANWRIYAPSNICTDNGSPDATVSYKFQGTKLKLYAEKNAFCGIAGIALLDETGNIYQAEQMVDFFSEFYDNNQLAYTTPDLPYGIYTIVIRVTGEVNQDSPFIQYDQVLQKLTPIYWTINLLKLEVFNSTATFPPTPTQKVTPTPTVTATATPTATPVPTFTPTPSPTTAPAFSDVGPDLAEGWACEYIQSLASLGIINGYNDGTFKPENYITRSEFIKVLTVAFGVYDVNATIDSFSDVKPADWFYAYVASGVNAELASPGGIGDGTFGAETYMSREQMVTFSARALIKYKGYAYLDEAVTTGRLAFFNDMSEISDYAKNAVALCVDQGILSGYNENSLTFFKPANNINRAEVAKVTDMVVKLEDLRT